MKTLFLIGLNLGLCLNSVSLGYGQDYGPGGRPQKLPPHEWRTSKFRYLIYDDTIRNRGHSNKRREVGVFLDHEGFSLETLRELLRLISERFPDPKWLQVRVHTNLIDVPTPEERDVPGVSGMGDDLHRGRNPFAFLERTEVKRLVRYTPGPSPYIEMKTVVLQLRQ
jgi:hypothetical protein